MFAFTLLVDGRQRIAMARALVIEPFLLVAEGGALRGGGRSVHSSGVDASAPARP